MGKDLYSVTNKVKRSYYLPVLTCSVFVLIFSTLGSAQGIGFISHRTANKLPSRWQSRTSGHAYARHGKSKLFSAKNKHLGPGHAKQAANQPVQSIEFIVAHLQTKEIIPGIIYKKSVGSLRLNILDIDTVQAPVLVKPIIASEGSTRLQTVKNHTFTSHAIAAINANYFKNTGVPLGTLIIDGDWVAGPLYDRVALGISKSGFARIDRVGLGGTLCTSNPQVPKIWINNINAPRRSGCRTMAYSRRWGDSVHLQYDGCLVSIDAQGKVTDFNMRNMRIPYGGMVLVDSKDSALSMLQRGDQTYLQWQVSPAAWSDINQAVSGGPMLIKDNNYSIDLKAESFHSNWTSNSIKARTACGITANNHLLLVTVEGNHTLYDVAHILHKLGAVDAMNLDGGGSTTMVIHDSTVNMESKSKERRVAVALGIFLMDKKEKAAQGDQSSTNIPNKETLSMIGNKAEQPVLENQPVAN